MTWCTVRAVRSENGSNHWLVKAPAIISTWATSAPATCGTNASVSSPG